MLLKKGLTIFSLFLLAIALWGVSSFQVHPAHAISALPLESNGVGQTSTYTLTINYIDGDADRSAQMSINGGATLTLNFHGTNNSNRNYVQSMTVSVSLNAGNNTIKFSNASNWTPDFDWITVS